MSEPMRVDPALMAKGRSLVESASQEIKGYLNTLENDVNELLPGWQSKGSRGFSAAHAAWTAKATTINNALDDLGQKLGVVGVQTGGADDSVSEQFSSFRQ